MLAFSISDESFETICRRHAQIIEVARVVQHVELPQCLFLDAAKTFDERTHPKGFRGAVAKRSDHLIKVYRNELYVKRITPGVRAKSQIGLRIE